MVGHHEQPVADAVVARVDDHAEPLADVRREALRELGAAHPAGERDDPLRHAFSSSSTSPIRSIVSAS